MREPRRAACIIAWPARQSRSPLIHGYWLEKHGIDGCYRREEVPPERLSDFLRNLARHGYVGANLSLPHKQAALALSEPDDRARAIGAANTLWLANGVLRSTNTDVDGFVANLDEQTPGWDRAGGSAVVLGAGGAARAIAHGLIARGFERIAVVNRSLERARALQEQFGHNVISHGWDALSHVLPEASLVVNTTSLGMTGQSRLELDLSCLRDTTIVSDIVYVPLITSLLAAAKARGLRTADGLGMLMHQAVRGFALWFGVTPRVTAELRALVAEDLRKT